MRPIDVRHMGREKVICCWEVDGVLVDPGPQSTEETLLEALGGQRPKALLLTHIHFDHAGASGSLVRRWPDLEVYVHEKGAPHLADPEKLVSSAGRLYGGDEGLKRLWGEVVPVPEDNLRVLSGGEEVLDGAFRVEYTPGHASHHVCYLHEPSRWAFVGDVAGVAVPPNPFTLAPTPPPDIDVEAWERSIDVLTGWRPKALGLTHFGAAEDAATQHGAIREALDAQVALIEECGDDQERFEAELKRRAAARGGRYLDSLLQAAPPEHLFLGLRRWADKRAERTGQT